MRWRTRFAFRWPTCTASSPPASAAPEPSRPRAARSRICSAGPPAASCWAPKHTTPRSSRMLSAWWEPGELVTSRTMTPTSGRGPRRQAAAPSTGPSSRRDRELPATVFDEPTAAAHVCAAPPPPTRSISTRPITPSRRVGALDRQHRVPDQHPATLLHRGEQLPVLAGPVEVAAQLGPIERPAEVPGTRPLQQRIGRRDPGLEDLAVLGLERAQREHPAINGTRVRSTPHSGS